MHLEHINLVVSDIEKSIKFYRAAFPHWSVRASGSGQWYGKTRNWVHFGDDYQYISFNDDGVGENRDLTGHQIGLAHFAFVTKNVDQVIMRLKDAGFDIAKLGAENQYRKNIYFIDPAGYEVEFVEYLSDIPALRNNND